MYNIIPNIHLTPAVAVQYSESHFSAILYLCMNMYCFNHQKAPHAAQGFKLKWLSVIFYMPYAALWCLAA